MVLNEKANHDLWLKLAILLIDLKRNRVDGLIIAVTTKMQDMSLFQKLESIGFPLVFFARPPKDESFDYITADNYEGTFKSIEFLI